uniref:Cytochrome b-c1 complex subunit 7 n=1 Tax=Lygus hesperus TaxID=30085 RepID=A0A0A9XR18_LYGHE
MISTTTFAARGFTTQVDPEAESVEPPRTFASAIMPLWTKMVVNIQKKQQKKYLRKYGLYYEDALLDWKNPKLDLAISLLPLDVQQDRLRRIQRANYLRQNHEELDYTLRFYDPHTSYGLIDLYNDIAFKEKSDNSYL